MVGVEKINTNFDLIKIRLQFHGALQGALELCLTNMHFSKLRHI